MGVLLNIHTPDARYNQNLYPNEFTFQPVSVGGVTLNYNSLSVNNNKSIQCVSVTGSNSTFNLEQEITISRSGLHAFSFYLLKTNPNADWQIVMKVFVNGILAHTVGTDLTFESSGYINSNWNVYGQTFNFSVGDVVSFQFDVASGTASHALFISAPKFELLNKCFSYPSYYTYPESYYSIKTGWVDTTDTTNTQSLTANTDNLVQIATPQDENGGLSLLDSNAKITPTKLNDSISVDFAFSFTTPSGTNNYLNVYLKVNGVIYRAHTHAMLKATGVTDYVSVSFNLPVKTALFENGAEFYVNPSTSISITNRYIQVTKLHNGI